MRNMSFSKTTEQARDRSKTVTRRWGWWFLKPGDRVQQVEKAMGLKLGEKVKKIHVIEIVSCRSEYLQMVTKSECVREGFPDMEPHEFVEMLRSMSSNKYPDSSINRIEFTYVDDEGPSCGYRALCVRIAAGRQVARLLVQASDRRDVSPL